jgi:hypothetical protein
LEGASNFKNINIIDCTFNNIPNNAIDFWMVTNGTIINNTFNGTTSQKYNFGNGIRAQDLITTSISYNTFNNIARMGIEVLGMNSSQVTVSDNNITGSGNITGPFTAGVSISQGVHNSKVINNRVNNSSNGYEIAEGSTNIILANNISNFIRNRAVSISGLANNLYIHSNNWSNTFGPEEVDIAQSWNILYENNTSTNHAFTIGPGTRAKRGVLVAQGNNIKIYNNEFNSDYSKLDSESSPLYFYLSFPYDPTINGKRAFLFGDPNFPWTQYFNGTKFTPGIRGGSRGLDYARRIASAGYYAYGIPGGPLASTEAWEYIPNSILENKFKDGSLVDFRNNNSSVQDLDSEVTEPTTQPPSVTTTTPPGVTTTTTSTTTTTTTTEQPTTTTPQPPFEPTTTPEPPTTTTTLGVTTTFQPTTPLPPYTTTTTTIAPTTTTTTFQPPPPPPPPPDPPPPPPPPPPPGTTLPVTTSPVTTSPVTTLGPELSVFPGPIIILDPIDPDYGYVPPVVELPPPWWWWPKLPWIPPDILPPLTGDFPFYYLTGGPLQGFVPTKCIEPPKDPITDTPDLEIDPEDPVVVPPVLPPQERCIYPAPILPLENNFYAEIDIIQPTYLLSPSNTLDESEFLAESFVDEDNLTVTNEELAESVDCNTDDDCNNLSY